MRRSPLVAAGVAGAALLMTACGGGSSTTATSPSATAGATASESAAPSASATATAPVRDAKADLVIWADEKRANALKAVATKFGADNGVTVAVQTVSTDLQTNFITANTAGNGPDVVVGAHDWIGNMVQNGAISPLPLSQGDQAKYQPNAIKAVTYDGQLYGLPYAVENIALFRNTAMVPKAPATLEDLVTEGRAAVKAGKTKGVLNLQVGQNGDAYHLQPLYTSGGGYLFGTKANGDYDPTDVGVGKAGSVAAMKKIAALGEKGDKILNRSVSGDNSIALFSQKKSAFLVSGPWAIADLDKAGIKYDISPVPPFAGGKAAAPFIGVQAFYIASKAKNASLAQEFVLNAVNTSETMKALFDAEARPPAMTSVLTQVSASDPDIAKFFAAGKNGQILPAIPAMASVWDPLGKAEAAVVGGADPSSTITKAGTTITASLK